MRLFIVRHGETRWNREGRFQGRTDTELSELGLEQADRAAAHLSGHKFDAFVSSPLARARITAEKIAAACGGGSVEIIDGLTEICHGEWEGRTSDEVSSMWPDVLEAWHDTPHLVVMPGPGGESIRSVQIRSLEAVDEIASRWQGDVLAATHDAVIKVLLCSFMGAPLSSFWRFQIPNCGLTIAELREGHPPRVTLMGDAHFLGTGYELPEQKGL